MGKYHLISCENEELRRSNVILNQQIAQLRADKAELVAMGNLRRNTRWAKNKTFEGEWICVPLEDFDKLQALIAKHKEKP